MTNFELSIHFFLQLACIVGACRLIGFLARRLGQAQVVAEMIAGFLLGPSLFGWIAPGAHAWLFQTSTMPTIYVLAQIALTLYMFTIGLEFQADLVRRSFKRAASVSLAGIVAPFAVGGGLGMLLLGHGGFFTGSVTPAQAGLFMGAAMSITAFPMLARIIDERGLTGTMLGTMALAAGAIDDVAAWLILAFVVASFGGNPAVAGVALVGALAYVAMVFGPLRPWLRRLARRADEEGEVSPTVFTHVLLLLMLAAWFTDRVGVYSVFGAFVLGTAFPRGVLTRELQRVIGPLTVGLLLPLFFVYSGLNTRLSLVNTPTLWLIAIAVFLVACVGKGLACWLAARLNGATQAEALGVGTLMNARGLMELILLNIGLERGLITPTLFTILVLMAIGTTLMAYPLFGLVYRPAAGTADDSVLASARRA
jgi:Kef-type K+ transport system membrane component KefB